MQLYQHHKVLFVLAAVLVFFVLFVLVEIIIIACNGQRVPTPDRAISEGKHTIGSGPSLTFVVLGDSTTVAQGGDYAKGIAISAAEHLAASHTVTYQNFGVSGARAAHVRKQQVTQAVQLRPDVVLVAVGANDVTHVTSLAAIDRDMRAIADALYAANPKVKIVITGAAAMGSVPRFPQPVRALMGQRTTAVNTVMRRVAGNKKLVFAPIAEKTGPAFAKNPKLFARDKFHPNTEGYQLWVDVINAVL